MLDDPVDSATTTLPNRATKVTFSPGLYGTASLGTWQTASAADIHVSDGYYSDLRNDTPDYNELDNTANDWALVKLAPNGSGQHIGDVTGVVPVAPSMGRAGLTKVSVHYPAGGFFRPHCVGGSAPNCLPVFCTSPNAPVYATETSNRFAVGLGCPLMNGSSGGGIFSFANGQWWTVSVVSRGPDMLITGELNQSNDKNNIDGAYTVNTVNPELNADTYPDLLNRTRLGLP